MTATVRVVSHWRLKLALTSALSVGIIGGYSLISHHRWGRPHAIPVTWVDRRVPYRPGWVWAYQSLYGLTGTVPWLAATRRQVWRYAAGLLVVTAVAFATFILWPTASPRPAGPVPAGMAVLFAWDGPYAAAPSLHAAYLVYTLAVGRRILGRAVPAWVWAGLALWGLAVLYATLAIREHYAVDLLAGGGLAVVAYQIAWNGAGPHRPERGGTPHR